MHPHKCRFCQKNFFEFDRMRSHTSRHVKRMYAFRKMVKNQFHKHTGKTIDEHKTNVNTKWYECIYCKLPVRSRVRLMKHLRLHTSVATPKKLHRTSQNDDLLVSKQIPFQIDTELIPFQIDTELFKCSQCPAAFDSKFNLGSHLKIHFPDKYHCIICHHVLQTKVAWYAHSRTHNKKRHHQCALCGNVFLAKSSLKIHQQTHHTVEKPHQCTLCKESFQQFISLENHIRTCHAKDHPTETCPEYTCEICHLTFKTSYQLSKHAKEHNCLKPFKCFICDFRFLRKCDMESHLKCVHSGAKDYVCSCCGLSFGYRRNLLRHERTHAGAVNFKCAYCPSQLSDKNSLINHERKHKGIKPYACQKCTKTFTTASGLNYHMKSTHASEKAYKCTECDKSFVQKGDLTSHSRIHSGEKPFKCVYCDKSFTSNCHLRRHEKRHNKRGHQYKCTLCGKVFLNQRSLLLHQVSNHIADNVVGF